MPAKYHSAYRRCLASTSLTLAIFIATPWLCGQTDQDGAKLHAAMPLGGDSIMLQPAKQRLNMLVTVESKGFDNVRLHGTGRSRSVTDLNGNPVRYYPRELSFRFTIGSRTSPEETSPNTVQTTASADRFQSNLKFRLKVFHGIDSQNIEPAEAKIIGVPKEVPFDERIYHIAFALPEIPVEDRIMFEVLDEEGNRIAKFHLQLI
jgi:hypothetical protein